MYILLIFFLNLSAAKHTLHVQYTKVFAKCKMIYTKSCFFSVLTAYPRYFHKNLLSFHSDCHNSPKRMAVIGENGACVDKAGMVK